eukprot:493616_1
MELYSDYKPPHRDRRHYKSKSAATLYPPTKSSPNSKRIELSEIEQMHLTPGSLKFVDGLYLNISPYTNDSFNLKNHDHRHYKNSKTMNMHKHSPYHLPLIIPNKIKHRKHKHKRYKSQNPPTTTTIRLPKDAYNHKDHHHHSPHPDHAHRHHKHHARPSKHKRYQVPTNTPYHTPQKSHIVHKKKRKRNTHFKASKSSMNCPNEIHRMKLRMSDYRSRASTNSSSRRTRPLSLKVNATQPPLEDTISLSSSMEHNLVNVSSNVPTIGAPDLDAFRQKRQKRSTTKQRRTNARIKEIKENEDNISKLSKLSRIGVHRAAHMHAQLTKDTTTTLSDYISSSDAESECESNASSMSNGTHCSLRILCSVSSISTLSHAKFYNQVGNKGDKYGDIESLGVAIIYISSFEEYFGPNPKQLGHGGQGSIFKIDDDNVIKSYEMGSLGLNREIFALNNILGKHIEVYMETATEKKKAFIKLPLIRGENLMEYAQDLINNKKTSLRECHLQALFGQLFVSLFYLHSKGLIHRDIKIENVMVRENGEIEFIDFGHAIYIGQDLNNEAAFTLKWRKGATEIFGTDCVLSPELKYAFYDLNDGEYISYGTEIDFYSIGIMGAEIIYNVFDHSYQHTKWIQLLEDDIACNGNKSGLSLKCLNFLYGLIHTNPTKRLKIHQILNHPFLTEEVHDKLGYDNWYSEEEEIEVEEEDDDMIPDIPEFIPFIDDVGASAIGDLPKATKKKKKSIKIDMNINITMQMTEFERMVKQELVKHRITLICNGLMDESLSYHPRMQHLNKLLSIIRECVAEAETTYPQIAAFIISQFENPFKLQLRNYPNHHHLKSNKAKCSSTKDKLGKKALSLHKKLYQIMNEFTKHYKSEFEGALSSYLNIMFDCTQLNDYLISCMHRIMRVYAFKYKTLVIILESMQRTLQEKHSSTKTKQLCVSFVEFILVRYLERKEMSELKLMNHPTVLSLIEAIIKYGLNRSSIKKESQSLLKRFKLLDEKMDKMDQHKKKRNGMAHCVTPQVQVANRRKKYTKHVKKNKSMDNMCVDEFKRKNVHKLLKHSKSKPNALTVNKTRKSKTRHRNENKSKTKSVHYISLAYPPPRHHHNNNASNPVESTSEIHHFDDICAAANDDDGPFM